MKTTFIFEDLNYKEVDGFPSKLKEYTDKEGKLTHVGYYINGREQYVLLPKVFLEYDDGGKPKAFGNDLLDNRLCDDTVLNGTVQAVLEMLPSWYSRALHFYKDRNTTTNTVKKTDQNIVSSADKTDIPSLYECIFALESFYRQHKDLVLTVYHETHSGYDKINWHKTISKRQPLILPSNQVLYYDTTSRKKSIDHGEELMVLFYNTLDYIYREYGYQIADDEGLYELIPDEEFKDMVDEGEVVSILESNQNHHFSDIMVDLWQRLYQFHSRIDNVLHSHENAEEYLLVSNFDPVFADMVDFLISDREGDLLASKHQDDDKRIDHLFLGKSLFDPSKRIYYIGDSKYYSSKQEINGHSVGKQFTYATNILKEAMSQSSDWKTHGIFYYDEETDGFNLTPNFFLRGCYDYNKSNYENDELTLVKQGNSVFKGRECFFEDRLFDRNTLFLLEYSVNFLFLLKNYNEYDTFVGESFKRKLENKVWGDMYLGLVEDYNFYKCNHLDDSFLQNHFRELSGKILRFDKFDIIAVRNDDKIIEEIKKRNYTYGNI